MPLSRRYGRARRGTPSPGNEFATAGRYRAAFIVGNGTNRYESVEINFDVSNRCRNHAEHLRWIMANASVSITPGCRSTDRCSSDRER